MSKYEVNVWEYADEFKNLDTNETFYGYQICKLLEQKDQRIAELEAKLADSEKKNFELVAKINLKEHKPAFCILADRDCEALGQAEKLKQQLHDLPKKIVEEIRKWGQKHYNWVGDGTGYDGQDYNECIGFNMAIDQLNEILDAILKKFGGENE